MDLSGDDLTCVQPTPAVDNSERVRAYEIAAYLAAASFPFTIADGPPPSPAPSSDLTLNALVQHGVYKLDCDRAFLSLIDNRNQYICAEMTKNQPLAGQDPAQPLLLGTARIALEWGVCPYTMAVFHGKDIEIPADPNIVADQSYFCIKDFRKVPTFAARPYVAGYPHMVAYIEVPLHSSSGHILGSYCLVDRKEKDFLRPETLDTVREVTASISSYLNMKRAESGRSRSERMVHGLRQFVNERAIFTSGSGTSETQDTQPSPFKLPVFDRPQPVCEHNGKDLSPEMINIRDPLSNSSDISSLPSIQLLSLSSDARSTGTPASSHHVSDPFIHPSSCTSTNLDRKNKPPPPVLSQVESSNPVEFHVSTQISNLFSKAANTIGYAMDLDGLVFFDTTASGTQHKSKSVPSPLANDEILPTVAHEGTYQAEPLSVYHDAASEQQLICRPSQSLIQELISTYPQGHVFAIDEHGVLDNYATEQSPFSSPSGTQVDWSPLFKCVPNARYILFLPLWHYQREACFATCLAWVSSTGKTLDSGDTNSLTVFGNSLMAEIFRLEALMNTQSKSDFISSISHELRSPLHGILTTVELMQETTREPELLSMVEMIESCSSALLDTFDHLLEFSKINSRASPAQDTDKVASGLLSTDTHTKDQSIDLQALVDAVVEMVCLSHKSNVQMESSLNKEHGNASPHRAYNTSPKPLMLTTHIDQARNWVIPFEKGAWTRVILNVCSNAMKYTQSGHIEVALRVLKQEGEDGEYISFVVTDTGIGMSEEFLKYHLFKPFMQENNLSPGSGLGLNIVKNIVESLRGRIFVESHRDEGTRVSINIPLEPGHRQPTHMVLHENCIQQGSTHGMSLGMLSVSAAGHGLRVVSSPEVLQRSIRNICEGKLGMKMVEISPAAPLDLDVLFIDTHTLASNEKHDLAALSKLSSGRSLQAVIILGVPVDGIAHIFGAEQTVCVASPITGKRLKVALDSALEKRISRERTCSKLQLDPDTSRGLTETAARLTHESLNRNQHSSLKYSEALPMQATKGVAETARPFSVSPSKDVREMVNITTSKTSCRFKRFLLVDDNPINLKVLIAFAQRLRVPFSTAINGAEAVHLYRQAALEDAAPFDCIFMDLSMPVMNGFEAVNAIRQFEAEQQRLGDTNNTSSNKEVSAPAFRAYILALTGLGSEIARSTAKQSGFDEFLVKPVRFKYILPMLLLPV